MPTSTSSALTPPPSQRESIKHNDNSTSVRSKRKEALKEFGRRQRHAILQQHRHSLSQADLQGQLHASTMAAIRAELHHPVDDGGLLTPADIDSLLQDIEQQVIEDIQAELADWERHEQEQLLLAGNMAQQHLQYVQQHAQSDTGLLCPVCKSCQLMQRQGRLVCPREGWCLNIATDALSIDTVRARLAAAYEEHVTSGCCGQLRFSIEDLYGADALTAGCTTCKRFAVVV